MIKKILIPILYFVSPFLVSAIGGIIGLVIGVDPKYNGSPMPVGFIFFTLAGLVIGFFGGAIIGFSLCGWKRWVLHDPSRLVLVGLLFNFVIMIIILLGAAFIYLNK